MTQMHEWEQIYLGDTKGTKTYRMEVPGGWLYRVRDTFYADTSDVMCFVPFPQDPIP